MLVEHGATRDSEPSGSAWISGRALAAAALAGKAPVGGRIVMMGYRRQLRPMAPLATTDVRVSFGSALLMHAVPHAPACVYATPEVELCQG